MYKQHNKSRNWLPYYKWKRNRSLTAFAPRYAHQQQTNNNQQTIVPNLNLDKLHDYILQSVKDVAATVVKDVSKDVEVKVKSMLQSLIEQRTKFYVDQRIGLLMNDDSLLKRGANTFKIDSVNNSFKFMYNGEAVAYVNNDGHVYCKNVWINGINILSTIANIFKTEQDIATTLSEYVKHAELKDGTYEMNISDIITQTANIDNATINNATITDTTIDNAVITTGSINNLSSTSANITQLTSTNATITNGTIYTLTSSTGNISNINSDSITNSGSINNNGNITNTGTITSTGSITTTSDVNATNIIASNSVDTNVYYGNTSNVTNVNATTVDTTYLKTYKISAKTPVNGATNNYVVIDNSNFKVNGLRLKHIYDNLPNQTTMYNLIGANENQSGCSYLQFYYDNTTPANTYLHIGIQGYNGLKIFNTKLQSLLPHYFDNFIDVTGVSYLRNNVNIYGNVLSQLNPTMQNNNNIHMYLGRDVDTDCHALHVRYNYGTTDLNNYAGIGLNNYEHIRIYKDNVSIDDLASSYISVLNCDVTNDLNVTNDVYCGGNCDIDGHCGIDGNCMINGNLTVQGQTIYQDEINVTGDANVAGDLSCNTITVNNIPIDVPNIAYTNTANTFTQAQTFNANITTSGDITVTKGSGKIYMNGGTNNELRMKCANNDYGRIYAGSTGTNNGYFEIATADDHTEPIYVRQWTGVFNTLTRTLTLLDANGNTELPVKLITPAITLNGNDLSTTLANKSDVGHTHTTNDITDWTTATANFAKLNAANTFTGRITINNKLDVLNEIKIGNTNDTPSSICLYCGTTDLGYLRANNTGNEAGYVELASCDNGNEPIYVRQYQGQTLKHEAILLDANGNTVLSGTLTVPSISATAITCNGESVLTTSDLNNVAYTNVNNNFTSSQTINLDTTATKIGLNIVAPNLNTNAYTGIMIGQTLSSAQKCGFINYIHQNNVNTNRFQIGMWTGATLAMFKDHATLNYPLTINGDVTCPSITLNGNDLATTLSNKSDVGHTHTTNDITDWTTATANFAKTNAVNTFTECQNIKASLNIRWGVGLTILDPTITQNNRIQMIIGYKNDAKNAAKIGWVHDDDGSDNNKLTIGFHGVDDVLSISPSKLISITSGGSLSTPAITLNGNDLSTTLSNKSDVGHTHTTSNITDWTTATANFALTNAANTFTAIQTINKDAEFPLVLQHATLSNDQWFKIKLTDGTENAVYGLGKDSDGYYNYIKLNGKAAQIQIYSNQTKITKPVTIDDVLTATKLETSNNTAATSLGTNLTTAINELITSAQPVMTNVAYTNISNNFTQSQTINNSNILTSANVWSSGNNYDVIPYTNGSNTRIGKYLTFYNSDTTTTAAAQLYVNNNVMNITNATNISGYIKATNFSYFAPPATWDDTATIATNLGLTNSILSQNPLYLVGQNFPASYWTTVIMGCGAARCFMLCVNKEYVNDDIRVYFNNDGNGQSFGYTDTSHYSRLVTHRNLATLYPTIAYTNVSNNFTQPQTITSSNDNVDTLLTLDNTTATNQRYLKLTMNGYPITVDKYNDSININNVLRCQDLGGLNKVTYVDARITYMLSKNVGAAATNNMIAFGYSDDPGNCISIDFTYVADDDANNKLTMCYWDKLTNILEITPAVTNIINTLQCNGENVLTTSSLTNVAYKNINNNFSTSQSINGTLTATTITTTGTLTATNATCTNVNADNGSYSTSLTLNGNSVLTSANVWTSGNNWDVIPYTDSTGHTHIGKFLQLYNTDVVTTYARMYYDGTSINYDKPLYIYETNYQNPLRALCNFTTSNYDFGNVSSGRYCRITVNGDSTLNNRYVDIGLHNYEAIRMRYNSITLNYNTTCNNMLTANTIETADDDPDQVIGQNLTTAIESLIEAKINAKKDELFQEMYPINSVWITYDVPDQIYPTSNDQIRVDVHNCVFELLPPNTYIKNIQYHWTTEEDDTYDPPITYREQHLDEDGGDTGTITVGNGGTTVPYYCVYMWRRVA